MTCDWHDSADDEGRPAGSRCGLPATRLILWRDGRYSYGCDAHSGADILALPETKTIGGPGLFDVLGLSRGGGGN